MTDNISSQPTLPDTVWDWALDELAAFGRQWRQLKEREAESPVPAKRETIQEVSKTDQQDTK